MAYRPASLFACVTGFTYHRWSAAVVWGLPGVRAAEWQTCVRCGCKRYRTIDGRNKRKGQGWQYREGVRPGDRTAEDRDR